MSEWIRVLTIDGWALHDLGIELLKTLGGLQLFPPGTSPIKFDPVFAYGELDRVIDWQRASGELLFPLGNVLSRYILFVGPSGRIYVGSDEELDHMGESIDVALERLYYDRGGHLEPVALPQS